MLVKPNQVIEINDGIFRVLKVRDTVSKPLSPSTYKRRPYVNRSRYLATCRHTSKKIVSVYTQDPYMDIRPLPFVSKLVMFIFGKLPR